MPHNCCSFTLGKYGPEVPRSEWDVLYSGLLRTDRAVRGLPVSEPSDVQLITYLDEVRMCRMHQEVMLEPK